MFRILFYIIKLKSDTDKNVVAEGGGCQIDMKEKRKPGNMS